MALGHGMEMGADSTEEHGRSTCRDQNEGQGQTGIEREIAAITEPASGMFCDPNLWEEKMPQPSCCLRGRV